MSKRLQVVVSDADYRDVTRLAKKRAVPVAEVVRQSLRRTVEEAAERSPEERIANVLRFARFSGPTGDLGSMLEDIEKGRDLG
jgi:hypothetical protein